ncbi:MAG TPA: hypothetical protein PLN79_05365, partial [bacterium]|nr:hypothetical protein [bacterium]
MPETKPVLRGVFFALYDFHISAKSLKSNAITLQNSDSNVTRFTGIQVLHNAGFSLMCATCLKQNPCYGAFFLLFT